jgi:hypothetical protein
MMEAIIRKKYYSILGMPYPEPQLIKAQNNYQIPQPWLACNLIFIFYIKGLFLYLKKSRIPLFSLKIFCI